ncbi:cryptochrome/photolyase family protein [Flexivirga sp. B27]
MNPSWQETDSDEQALAALRDARAADDLPKLPAAGEPAALQRWRDFVDETLDDYDSARDRPDLAGTSGLSPYLKVGAIHPRTLLADLAAHIGPGRDTFVSELAWREFYADVLWRQPRSAWHDLTDALGHMPYDEPGPEVEAWQQGRTGFPFVDAGMRQLLATGWMHNRVRMVTASFLTKDLHVWWPVGARHFLDRLIDGDIASNNHGWQWVAGTGTDAAPYFRIFNPVTQGKKFDPGGDYVRRWIPELRHLPGKAAHEPWRHADGYREGYPARVVDHAAEREAALVRYRER